MKNLFQLASALTIGLLVSACGGPSGGSAGETSEQSFSVEPGINLYMSISSTGEESIRIPANDDANVDILFLDESNNPVANEIVNLSASSGTLSQSSILTISRWYRYCNNLFSRYSYRIKYRSFNWVF